ncbi:hypothetical protein QMZ05_12735 [Bradyrhizobium sp. INPA03-11B]|uniref:hypothetical protein n=1 Tax=Bradyrhizobium sp. INPA03-11B TaxID=418598 RepID=UPI0033903BB9
MHSSFSEEERRFTATEHANFIAGKVVAYATAYLDGRHDLADLARNAASVMIDLLLCSTDDREAKAILDPARLLASAMIGTACAASPARLERWQKAMGAMVELVKHVSTELRESGVQRS